MYIATPYQEAAEGELIKRAKSYVHLILQWSFLPLGCIYLICVRIRWSFVVERSDKRNATVNMQYSLQLKTQCYLETGYLLIVKNGMSGRGNSLFCNRFSHKPNSNADASFLLVPHVTGHQEKRSNPNKLAPSNPQKEGAGDGNTATVTEIIDEYSLAFY